MLKITFNVIKPQGEAKYEFKENEFRIDNEAFKVKKGYRAKYQLLLDNKDSILSYVSHTNDINSPHVIIKFFNDNKVVESNKLYNLTNIDEMNIVKLFTDCLEEGIE